MVMILHLHEVWFMKNYFPYKYMTKLIYIYIYIIYLNPTNQTLKLK